MKKVDRITFLLDDLRLNSRYQAAGEKWELTSNSAGDVASVGVENTSELSFDCENRLSTFVNNPDIVIRGPFIPDFISS